MSVTFVPFSTFVDPSLWAEVNRRKLNDWKLDDSVKPARASFSNYGRQMGDCCLTLSHDAFSEADPNTVPGLSSVSGELKLTNSLTDFLQLDRKQILNSCAQRLWDRVTSGAWLTEPSVLNSFFFTAYADLKQYRYYHWNAVPAVLFPNSIARASPTRIPDDELWNTASAYGATRPFIVIQGEFAVPISEVRKRCVLSEHVDLVFPDPSTVPQQPGWPLRNLLAAVAYERRDWNRLRVLALRRNKEDSFVIDLTWSINAEADGSVPWAVGWERNTDGKLTYNYVDLKSAFDPVKLMEQSVDLNLKLIRWRLVPSIDLQRFADLKVLMAGSGTLGCNLARALLGWGVRYFTFLDNSVVSYNNPVRQSLFTFEDCLPGNKSKAAAAAESLQKIYPSVVAKSIDMKIPMPGHPISEKAVDEVKSTCELLDKLVQEHDVIFLVMDSRESRWLPTLLASFHNKLAITVALGFDSFVIVRHGVSSETSREEPAESSTGQEGVKLGALVPGGHLGCYFCSDVTAPGNSVADRTLDQQCTVTRPGVSMAASGMAVELLSSVLQHELGTAAPALLGEVDENATVLGATPHQIRCFLSGFHLMLPTVRRFDKCTACGETVRGLYERDGFQFLRRVFDDPMELERVTGLTELYSAANNLQLEMLDFDDNESV